ncbi:hypothetical protein FQN50_002219 [Emmonsiellopsis sp. PD_5]|nr:hypothetical protein FQN50_002219 [Emmonsiellopsis sp. PD_5]
MGMFSTTYGGLGISIDVEKERNPPPPATPLDFPDYSPDPTIDPPHEGSCDVLYKLLSSIKKPQDLSPAHLKALNLTTESNVPIEDIVPNGILRSLAPYQWPEQASTPDAPGTDSMPVPILMSNGAPFPNKERYDSLKKEILYDNDEAFRSVNRMPPRPGQERIKIAHSRKFWGGLDLVSQYWDTSLDKYVERPLTDEATEAHDKTLDKMHLDDNTVPENKPNDNDTETKTENGEERPKTSGTKTMYLGRRVGTGREMPEDSREETLRGFMEMIAWAFGCQTTIPSLPPRLQVKGMLFPVRQNFVVARSPQDRQVARKGILEGPMLFVQCRGETSFHDEKSTSNSRYAEICDLLRETAAMLLFAQERARAGATEARPGDGKWWTTTPRWGGAENPGPEAEKENNDSKTNPPSDPDAQKSNKRSKYDRPALAFRRPGSSSRKLSMSEKWKILQPGPSLWDKKMRYMQIGKDNDSDFDDIFMVSSLNHHFSIVHLRIHHHYLEWLATGNTNFPDDDSSPPWYGIHIRRTKWFDHFSPSDRVEALDGMWALFSYLMR